jgi:hypothetical protein
MAAAFACWRMPLTACAPGPVAQVMYKETKMSFLHFLTSVCAIVGGIFTVSGIIDAFIYHGHQAIKKKVDLGKQI